jgi:hypothetical protein
MHKLSYNVVGSKMFAVCDTCGASARVKMSGHMTERKGMVYDQHHAKAKLYAHLMASKCFKEPVPAIFPLIA